MILKPSATTARHRAAAASRLALAMGCLALTMQWGCLGPHPPVEEQLANGCMFYLDGAGGGGILMNWGRGVQRGMRQAGYRGAGEEFSWQTGLGVAADQAASVAYKRSKAAELAQNIEGYTRSYEKAPVTLTGLSAGTAVGVFALEALPEDCAVDHAVLLGTSLSANYDLTAALARVRKKMYVFTSQRDAVLRFLVPIGGTADRQYGGAKPAGLSGFELPPDATQDTLRQYAKLEHIPWREEFRRSGHAGGHTDVVNSRFVAAHVAPLVMPAPTARPVSLPPPPVRKIRNPDYARWVTYDAGSWVQFEGYQSVDGVRQAVRIRELLLAKYADTLLLQRSYTILDQEESRPPNVRQVFTPAWINPEDHLLEHPRARSRDFPQETLVVAGKPMPAEVRFIGVEDDVPEWGRNIRCELYLNDHIPGGMLRVDLHAFRDDQPFEFFGDVVAYEIGP